MCDETHNASSWGCDDTTQALRSSDLDVYCHIWSVFFIIVKKICRVVVVYCYEEYIYPCFPFNEHRWRSSRWFKVWKSSFPVSRNGLVNLCLQGCELAAQSYIYNWTCCIHQIPVLNGPFHGTPISPDAFSHSQPPPDNSYIYFYRVWTSPTRNQLLLRCGLGVRVQQRTTANTGQEVQHHDLRGVVMPSPHCRSSEAPYLYSYSFAAHEL